jgi:hypothetical protein
MSASDSRRDDDLDDFVEAQEGDYEPAPAIHDPDDLPVDDEDDAEEDYVPDDDRRVPLDDDGELE